MQPGLKRQHLTGLQLVEQMCDGTLSGGAISSTDVTLTPSRIDASNHVAATGTAGSCTLMAQSTIPCALFARSKRSEQRSVSTLTLEGGTDAGMAPPTDYMEHVLLPTLRRLLNADVHMTLKRRGFYPKGGGQICVSIRNLEARLIHSVRHRTLRYLSTVNPGYNEPFCTLANGSYIQRFVVKDAISLDFVRVVPIRKVPCIQEFVV